MISRFTFIAAVLWLTACSSQTRTLTVSAASDLGFAFTELGMLFEQENGTRVTFNFGSTGMLAQQIAQGAPVDLFAAADRTYVDDLAARGVIIPETVRVYARGRIVLYTHRDTPVQNLSDVTRPDIKRIAIANPDHAPYGRAARQALQNAGVWSAVESKIVLAENIQQTQQFADTGNVDAAIIALSLAMSSKGKWSLVPQELHQPIDQGLGVVKNAQNERAARAFAVLVSSPNGQAILKKYGFETPKQ